MHNARLTNLHAVTRLLTGRTFGLADTMRLGRNACRYPYGFMRFDNLIIGWNGDHFRFRRVGR